MSVEEMLTGEIIGLLNAAGTDQEELFDEARRARERIFDGSIILRGVIEITNLCRVDCDYCPMRRSNSRVNDIYALSAVQILDSAKVIKRSGINVVFLQAGEVPRTTEIVAEAIPLILDLFDGEVEVLLNLGNKSRAEYEYLRSLGAMSYILKHETSDRHLHEFLRHDSFEHRIQCLKDLIELGYKVGTGTIVGLPGQQLSTIADDITLARSLRVHMSSASPFVPAPNTPLEKNRPGSVDLTLNTIAAMRLSEPGWLIPSVSALEKNRQGGQASGLRAGANVMTINFTPSPAQKSYLIYGQDRFIVAREHVETLLRNAGLRASGSIFVSSSPGG